MLAIISDLHFCDETACQKNVDPKAFGRALHEIYAEASDVHQKRKDKTGEDRVCQVDLVMLGDVFDLLRTTAWFDVPVAERPWGSASALDVAKIPAGAPVLQHAHAILDAIIAKNQHALAALRGELGFAPPAGVEVRRILLPGNHDRLALHDDTLYAKMRAAVGAADEGTLAAEGIHLHRLEMREYGLLARHGHEWDFFNFESFDLTAKTGDYIDEKYLPAPIGDPITTELATRLPHEIEKALANVAAFDQTEKDEIKRRLQRVEDVRPLLASIVWVYQEAVRIRGGYAQDDKRAALSDALDASVQTVIREFRELAYYKEWLKRHDHFNILHPFGGNPAGMLDDALRMLAKVRVATVETLAPAFEGLLARATGGGDDSRKGAEKEQLHLDRVGDRGLRFVVYGHTHDADEVALSAADETQDMYLNSGTFRQRIFLTSDRKGFVPSDYISFLYFFREDEAAVVRDPPSDFPGPAYAAWTGLRSR